MNDARGDLLLGSAPFVSPPTVADVPVSRYPPGESDPGAGTSHGFLCNLCVARRPVEPIHRVRRRQRSDDGDHQQSEQPYF